MQQLPFNDGHTIPQLGLGVWQTPDDETAAVVRQALACGYRHFDGAAIYANESGLGAGLRQTGVPRGDIFVTTKLWNDAQGYESALRAFEASLQRLGLDYVDLYLIHWASPTRNLYLDSWRALIRLRAEGRVRSIGVCNFAAEHLDRIIGETGVAPVLNQIELHPHFQQRPMRAANAARGILTQSWSPLGQPWQADHRTNLLTNPIIQALAAKHGKTPAQIIIRWHLDSGLIAIPKSATPHRIRENFDLFDFQLDATDMAAIDALDDPSGRIGPDPSTANF